MGLMIRPPLSTLFNRHTQAWSEGGRLGGTDVDFSW